jgi:16S rRNA (guanine(966)-N(2))-methyltransferase RsmD
MRVIAGEFRSRRLKSFRGLDVRPTPDRLREALFNVLSPLIEGSTFVDAYAGTGSVGIEALSRGAERVIFLERNRAAANILRDNLAALGIRDRAEVVEGRVLQYLPQRRADIVFLDPPYPLEHEYQEALAIIAANPPPLTVVQHAFRFDPGSVHGPLERTRILRQGDNALSFYKARTAE